MALRQLWQDTAALARESAYGTAPSSTLPWFQGGSYYMLPIIGQVPGPDQRKSTVEGAVGYRQRRTYAPIKGNRLWTGQITGPVMAEPLGALLYQVFGQESASQTADAGNPLATIADLSVGTLTVTNPTTSAFLRFVITSAAGSSMSIAIVGVDANGRTVSETISVTLDTGAATVQSRYSYDTITTCTAAGFSSGACTVNGYTKSAHTFTLANTPVSGTVVNLGDANRGSGEAGFYKGSVIQQFTLAVDAGMDGGLITYGATFKGKYPTQTTAPTLYPTVDRGFAGWNASVTKGGSSYAKIVRMNLQIDTGNNVLWAMDGTADPVNLVGGAFDVTGTMLLLPTDDTEWGLHEDNTESNFEITLSNTDDMLYTATYKSLLIELTRTYFTAARVQDYEGVQAIEVNFNVIRDSSDGNCKMTLTNGVYAY